MKSLLLALALTTATSLVAAPEKRTPMQTAPSAETGILPGKYPERSIYRVKSNWTDDAGKTVRLESLRGRPIVLALFFTNCQHSCPIIARDMKAMQAALSAGASARTQFVLVSIDPERDSAAALKAFRTKYKLTGDRWTLLTGSVDSVRQLAEKIGFNYAPGSKTQFAHSLLITVLNGTGVIAHEQVGTGVDRRGAISVIEKLAATKSAR